MSKKKLYRYHAEKLLRDAEAIFEHYEKMCREVLTDLESYFHESERVCNEVYARSFSFEDIKQKLYKLGKELIVEKFLNEKTPPFKRGYATCVTLINVIPEKLFRFPLSSDYFADPLIDRLEECSQYLVDLESSIKILRAIGRTVLVDIPKRVGRALEMHETRDEDPRSLGALYVFSGFEKPPWEFTTSEREEVKKYLELYKKETSELSPLNITTRIIDVWRDKYTARKEIEGKFVYFEVPEPEAILKELMPEEPEDIVEISYGEWYSPLDLKAYAKRAIEEAEISAIVDLSEGGKHTRNWNFCSYPFIDFRSYVKRRKEGKVYKPPQIVKEMHRKDITLETFCESDIVEHKLYKLPRGYRLFLYGSSYKVSKDYYFFQDEIPPKLAECDLKANYIMLLPSFVVKTFKRALESEPPDLFS
ncbi:hypothetical protein [Ferroglobus sp.]|uniref:hypothetical protein n=1 Tax=Ferroglobus sp. TaxID=2614230 RepID=UPI0025C3F9CE|nr:hypothetical protein [Ferroglobus sp.]